MLLPYAFTEPGAVTLANVVNSPRAVGASIEIVRAFVRLRQLLVSHAKLAWKLDQLERKYDTSSRRSSMPSASSWDRRSQSRNVV